MASLQNIKNILPKFAIGSRYGTAKVVFQKERFQLGRRAANDNLDSTFNQERGDSALTLHSAQMNDSTKEFGGRRNIRNHGDGQSKLKNNFANMSRYK
jgi:hypothetical protein